MNIENCSVCGQACTIASLTTPRTMPIYGTNDKGEIVCQKCEVNDVLQRIENGDKIYGYLSGDGKTITTWPGEVIARVLYCGTSPSGFGGRMTYWVAELPSTKRIYGKCGGKGVSTLIRSYK